MLSNLGIDNVQINLAETSGAANNFNAELNSLLAGTTGTVGGMTFANELAAVREDGLNINTIDLGGAGTAGNLTLNQTQAGELVLGGLNFATGDNITLGADLSAAGQGTHLTTSLKDLQKLGVDAVAISGDADGNAATVNSINLDLGSGGALSAGGLPVFGNTDGFAGLTVPEDNALNVTLNVADAA